MNNVTIVGASVAGVSAVETLRKQGYDGAVTLVSAERELPYNRPPLSKELLTGELDEDDIRLIGADRLVALEITAVLGAIAFSLDTTARIVRTTGGDIHYDGLIIATGSAPVRPRRWPELEGVHTLRSLDDAHAIRAAMTTGRPRVVVIGAGFIGCEIASAARHHGLSTTIVETRPLPLQRAIGSTLAEPIARLHHDHGVRLRCGVGVRRLLGSARVEKVELTDGSALDADLVVIGVGAVPVTDWLVGSGLEIADGVVTDRTLRASAPDVYAAGDVARWRRGAAGSVRVEHWTNATEQGARAAANLLDPASAQPYAGVPYVWSDQHGRRIQLAGATGWGEPRFLAGGADEDGYLAVLVDDGAVLGAVGLNRTREFRRIRRLLDAHTAWADIARQSWSAA